MLWAAVAGAGTKPGDVWLQRDREPGAKLLEQFWHAVEQRSSGVPFAYAVGRVGFRTLDLRIDPRALIPRPETEGLVDLVLRETGMRDAGCGMRGVVADVGTGCGCIALSLAVEGHFDRVIAVERSLEPREALASGADGLTATRALLEGAAALLEPGGCVVLEIDERRADATRRLALRHGWSRVGVYDDLFGRRRFLLAGLDEEGGT